LTEIGGQMLLAELKLTSPVMVLLSLSMSAM